MENIIRYNNNQPNRDGGFSVEIFKVLVKFGRES